MHQALYCLVSMIKQAVQPLCLSAGICHLSLALSSVMPSHHAEAYQCDFSRVRVGGSFSVLAALCWSSPGCVGAWGGGKHLGLGCNWCHSWLGSDCQRPQRNKCNAEQAETHRQPPVCGQMR